MDNKYLILCTGINDADANKISETIKNIADKWFNVACQSKITLINTGDKKYKAAEIRDMITSRVSCNCLVLQIRTTKNSAAFGTFADNESWDWMKQFDIDDLIVDPEIPDVGINTKDGEKFI